MSRNPSYVVRQSCGYCYRQVVPPDLRDLVGRTELRYNLYTGSLRDAKSRARVISGQVHSLFIKIKREGYIMSDSQLTEAKINELIRGYVKQTVKEMELDRATSGEKLDSDGRIFPTLKRINHRYGHNMGRWFTDFKKRSGIEAEPRKKTFHSFRHTVTNFLKQNGVPVQMIAELVGHKTDNITMERYGKRYEPKKLYEGAVLKLDFGIDLGYLKQSKFVP